MMRRPQAVEQAAPRRDLWRLREGLLLLGFVLLVVAGVVSVVVPELGRDPEAGPAKDAAKAASTPTQ
jgi:hypothetical protein